MAFASNLLGAMVGGALEYLALLTGYRALLIVVACLYALAWLFATRWRRLADVELAATAVVEPVLALRGHPVGQPAAGSGSGTVIAFARRPRR